MLGIKPSAATCKTNTLPTVLLLQSPRGDIWNWVSQDEFNLHKGEASLLVWFMGCTKEVEGVGERNEAEPKAEKRNRFAWKEPRMPG